MDPSTSPPRREVFSQSDLQRAGHLCPAGDGTRRVSRYHPKYQRDGELVFVLFLPLPCATAREDAIVLLARTRAHRASTRAPQRLIPRNRLERAVASATTVSLSGWVIR